MNIYAESQKIRIILNKGSFCIPDHQREYDWEKTQVECLLEDIASLEIENSHFIGHMVVATKKKFNEGPFNVIDGQQRITTVTILLCVIRDIFYEREGDEEIEFANGIHNKFIFSKDVDNKPYVILENQMPYPTLQKYIQNKPEEKDLNLEPSRSGEKKIIQVYDYVKKELEGKTVTELKELRDKILDLEVVFVAVIGETDAFTIFEKLNATGKDLTPIDLFKNKIFKLYPRAPHIQEPNDSWKIILNHTENKGLIFLNNFWSSRYKKVAKQKIYREFEEKLRHQKDFDIKIFLEDLKSDAILFGKINSPKKQDFNNNGEVPVYHALDAIINVFRVRVANSVLISLLRGYYSKNISLTYLKRALNGIEKFHFIFNAISSKRSSGLDVMYAKFSREIFNASSKECAHRVIVNMINKLKERITPLENEYNENIDTKLLYSKKEKKHKKLVQYVLNKIEFSKQNENIELISLSLEHIYPERSNKDNWPRSISQEHISSIGNIVLLDSGLNSEAGNKKYITKKNAILKKSTILSTKEVFEKYNKWGNEEISKRKEQIAKKMYKDIWNA